MYNNHNSNSLLFSKISDRTLGINPICSLSIVPLDTFDTSEKEGQSSESVSIHKYGVFRDYVMKVVLKCEEDNFSDNVGDDISNNGGKFLFC